jgi:U3 small nucleolar RNA-associated protein 22
MDMVGKQIMAAETEMKKRRICIPFPKPRPAKDLQYLVAYAKPSYVNVAGSYALKSLLKQKGRNSIDLVLTMPPVCSAEKVTGYIF